MEKCQLQLLELLKAGLTKEKPDGELFVGADWKKLYNMAFEQSVVAVVFDGICLLQKDYMPPLKMKMQMISTVQSIENTNNMMNSLSAELTSILEDLGTKPVMMKGQAFATEYPNPLHRQSGDIDLFFRSEPENIAVKEWAQKNAEPDNKINDKDYPFHWKGVEVESHFLLCMMYNKKNNDLLQSIIRKEFEENAPVFVDVCGKKIETVPPTLNVLHQIIHISYHFLNEGIGLRQFCDLALYLRNHADEIDYDRLKRYLSELGFGKLTSMYGHLLNRYLGVDANIIPFEFSDKYFSLLADCIFTGGNFGKKVFGFKGKDAFFKSKIKAMPLHLIHYIKYRHFNPKELDANFLVKWKRAAKGIK